MYTAGSDTNLSVLVVDDDKNWVDTLVARFEDRSIRARGISQPGEIVSLARSNQVATFDMIFLDMRLGTSKAGVPITAAEMLLDLMTYSPDAKVVVFTQQEITVDECVRCIQFGALGVIPKTSELDDLILVARVYRYVGDEQNAREERIRSLWAKLENDDAAAKGRRLEMFVSNLFNSIDGFKVVTHNKRISAGEIDLVIENRGSHEFWTGLNSLHIAVECKNESAASEIEEFNTFARKVEAKDRCEAGIFVSLAGVSIGFRELQRSLAPRIFVLDRSDIYGLVRQPARAREGYLRSVLSRQL